MTTFDCYIQVFKQMLPATIALIISSLLFPAILTFLLTIFVFGMLYVNSYAVLIESAPLPRKQTFFLIGKKFLPAFALTLSIIGLCIFSFVGYAVPFNLLPNSLLSKILSSTVFDIILLIIFTLSFIAISIYVSYSLMYFWLDDTGIFDSLEKSYKLVKGQWWRAALYFCLSNLVPLVLFLLLPVALLSLLAMAAKIDPKVMLNASVTQLLLLSLVVGLVYPLQIIINISFFQKLKMRKGFL